MRFFEKRNRPGRCADFALVHGSSGLFCNPAVVFPFQGQPRIDKTIAMRGS